MTPPDDFVRAELGALLMVALGCRVVSVVQAVVVDRRRRADELTLFGNAA